MPKCESNQISRRGKSWRVAASKLVLSVVEGHSLGMADFSKFHAEERPAGWRPQAAVPRGRPTVLGDDSGAIILNQLHHLPSSVPPPVTNTYEFDVFAGNCF